MSALATEGYGLAIRHTARPPDTHVAWALCASGAAADDWAEQNLGIRRS